MKASRVLAMGALLGLAACGGGGGEEQAAPAEDTVATQQPMPTPAEAARDTAGLSPGDVDTAGMGTNPPTAGGQLVDTAAVPGAVDTTRGTTTAP